MSVMQRTDGNTVVQGWGQGVCVLWFFCCEEKNKSAKMCCSGFLKIMMFIFNGGIFLAGAAILGVGVWVKVDSGSLLGLLDNVEGAPSGLSQLVYVSYMLIAVGAVLLVIGFLGCCGAVKESRCMLLTFFSIVLIIFLVEVAGAVVLLVVQGLADELLQSLENEVKISIEKEYGQSESLTSLWNGTMEQFKCCGFNNYTDFDGSPFYNDHGGNVYPHTCCNATITVGVCNTDEAHNSMIDGCFNKLLQLIEDNAVIIAAVALGIAALEIAAMVVSMVLYNQIGKKA
ncbi:tetraspanin-1-like [Enoplosus armatus]|uniref:tetraspanin-1-like n=1 Tax=Enoplosus armatus TaxID=215367 RepID=UPI0039944461